MTNHRAFCIALLLSSAGCSLWAESNANSYRGGNLDSDVETGTDARVPIETGLDGTTVEDVAVASDTGLDTSSDGTTSADVGVDVIADAPRDAANDTTSDVGNDVGTTCLPPSGAVEETRLSLTGFGPVYRLPILRHSTRFTTNTTTDVVVVAGASQDALVYRNNDQTVFSTILQNGGESANTTLVGPAFGWGRMANGNAALITLLPGLPPNTNYILRELNALGIQGTSGMQPAGVSNVGEIAVATSSTSVRAGFIYSVDPNTFRFRTHLSGSTEYGAMSGTELVAAADAFLFVSERGELTLTDGRDVQRIMPTVGALGQRSIALISPGANGARYTAFGQVVGRDVYAWDVVCTGISFSTCAFGVARMVTSVPNASPTAAAFVDAAHSVLAVGVPSPPPAVGGPRSYPGEVRMVFSGCRQTACDAIPLNAMTTAVSREEYPDHARLWALSTHADTTGRRLRVVVSALVSDQELNTAAIWSTGYFACAL